MQRKVRKKLFQKNILILFCLALIFSPFSSLGELAYAEGDEKQQSRATDKGMEQDDESDDSDEGAKGSIEDTEPTDDDEPSEPLGEDDSDDTSEENTTDMEAGKEEEVKETDSTIQPSSARGFQILATTPEDDYEWEDNGDGTVTITGYTGTDTNIVIPDVLDGKPITVLGERAFSGKNIQSIKLPDTIKTIDVLALYNNQLTSIDLPEGLERINDNAFNQNKLTSVEIPSSVEWIGNHTFLYNVFTSITIYGKNTYIVKSAFDRGLGIPYDNLTVYGFINSTAETYAKEKGYTFEPFEGTAISIQAIDDIEVPFGMEGEDISLPEEQEVTVEINGKNKIIEVEIDWDEGTPIYNQNEVGTYMFEGELLLDPHMKNPNNLTAEVKVTVLPLEFEWSDNGDGTATITGYNGSDTEVFIPKQIDGKDVTIIGEEAFDQLGLTKVTLPNTLKTIEKKAFNRNSLTAVNIPEGVTSLGEAAFRGNKLETVIFPSTLQTMGDYVFTANKLKEIELPDSLTDMGIWAFRYNKLESIKFPKNLSEIPGLAFEDNQLTSIEIPDFVEVVRIKAFNENPLEEVIIYNENLQLGENVFAHETRDPQDVVIKGYEGSTAETYATANNHNFDPFIEMPDENLKQVINLRLGKTTTSELTATDLERLTELNVYRADISDLTGLQYATNLTRLSLESNDIKDISVLENLTNLEELNLGDNDIGNLSSLRSLINLNFLFLYGNQISDVSHLSGLTHLEELDLGYNDISNLSPLRNLTNLNFLFLYGNQISDVSHLSGLTRLKVLDIGINRISDLSPLEGLTNLEALFINENQIGDLSPLGSYFGNLQDGSLEDQEVTLPTLEVLSTAKTVEIDNPITFHDGSIINDVIVQDGTYDNPKIKWDVTGTETERTFTFEEQNYGFSGTVTQPIEWVEDEKPVIHASDISILLNEPFDPLDGVTSTDKESGNLTNDIVVLKNEVDTSVPGVYEVTYEVTDRGGQTVEKTIKVTVTKLEVTEIADLGDITVANGTDKSDIGLPTEVDITLNDDSTQNIDVVWDDGDPAYDKSVAGDYIFTGTLDLPTGVVNTNDVEVTVTVAPQQLILPLGIKTEVFAGQVGTIEGTDTQITFPHDLPSGTFVMITDVSGEGFVTNAEGIERAGNVLDFKFDYPSGQSYTGSFELTMSYGNGFATEIDIYYYNENDAKWEAQNGTMDTNNNTITIHPDHFSTYGVFALEEDKPGDDPKGNGESEGSAPNGDGDNGNGKPITVDGGSDENDIKGTGDQVLSKTATNTFNMIAVGLILLVLGGISFVFIRRRALKQ